MYLCDVADKLSLEECQEFVCLLALRSDYNHLQIKREEEKVRDEENGRNWLRLNTYRVHSVIFVGTKVDSVLHSGRLVTDIVTNPCEHLLVLLSVVLHQVGLIGEKLAKEIHGNLQAAGSIHRPHLQKQWENARLFSSEHVWNMTQSLLCI